jgi:hypothetical protein
MLPATEGEILSGLLWLGMTAYGAWAVWNGVALPWGFVIPYVLFSLALSLGRDPAEVAHDRAMRELRRTLKALKAVKD